MESDSPVSTPGGEMSSMALALPPMMERPGSIVSAGSAGSHDRHVLVCRHCVEEPNTGSVNAAY